MTEMSFDQLCELFAYEPKRRPLDSREVAEILGVHPNTMEQYRFRGEGPRYFKLFNGRTVRCRLGDVLAYRDAQMVGKRVP